MRVAIPLLIVTAAIGANWAACDLGVTPLDCIHLADPSLSKRVVWEPTPALPALINSIPNSNGGYGVRGGTNFDAAGNYYFLLNGTGGRDVYRMNPQGDLETVVLADPALDAYGFQGNPMSITVDAVNGVIYISFGDSNLLVILAVSGLPTAFDLFQSYIPTSSELRFVVPRMPEGFPAADSFDTYYGDLATVGDWSHAQALQCGYPATPPRVGDYLQVADPLPNPEPGHGRYYVTAVSYLGQRRYGRKSSGGVLSGRDPVLLPACAQ